MDNLFAASLVMMVGGIMIATNQSRRWQLIGVYITLIGIGILLTEVIQTLRALLRVVS